MFAGVDVAASKNGFRFESVHDILHTLFLVGVGGTLAFAMVVAEFAIVQMASSLTLSIIGVTKVRLLILIHELTAELSSTLCKHGNPLFVELADVRISLFLQEVVSVTVSIVRNGRELVPLNIVGMIICLGGIAAHVVRKATQPSEGNKNQIQKLRNRNTSPRKYAMLSQSSSESDSDNQMFLDLTRQDPSTKKSISSSDKYHTVSAQPLLWNENESEFSSDEDTFQLTSLKSDDTVIGMNQKRNGDKTWNSVGDDFFLRDNRTWTSVRDAHVQMRYDTSFQNEAADSIDTHMKAPKEHDNEILINTEES